MTKDDYSDLLDLEHPTFPNHPPMSMHERATQFSALAALTGFAAELEKARAAVEAAQTAPPGEENADEKET